MFQVSWLSIWKEEQHDVLRGRQDSRGAGYPVMPDGRQYSGGYSCMTEIWMHNYTTFSAFVFNDSLCCPFTFWMAIKQIKIFWRKKRNTRTALCKLNWISRKEQCFSNAFKEALCSPKQEMQGSRLQSVVSLAAGWVRPKQSNVVQSADYLPVDGSFRFSLRGTDPTSPAQFHTRGRRGTEIGYWIWMLSTTLQYSLHQCHIEYVGTQLMWAAQLRLLKNQLQAGLSLHRGNDAASAIFWNSPKTWIWKARKILFRPQCTPQNFRYTITSREPATCVTLNPHGSIW